MCAKKKLPPPVGYKTYIIAEQFWVFLKVLRVTSVHKTLPWITIHTPNFITILLRIKKSMLFSWITLEYTYVVLYSVIVLRAYTSTELQLSLWISADHSKLTVVIHENTQGYPQSFIEISTDQFTELNDICRVLYLIKYTSSTDIQTIQGGKYHYDLTTYIAELVRIRLREDFFMIIA